MKQKPVQESDLYPPLKDFLEAQGYEVKGEVKDCDVVAMRGDESPVVVELKVSLNLTVVFQAIDRLAITPRVYIGLPNRCPPLTKRRKQVMKLMRMLGLGLVVIDPSRQSGVAVLLDPGPYKPRESKPRRERLLAEFVARVGDPNAGGATKRRGLMTAYRQRALAIASYLQKQGPSKAAQVAATLHEPKAREILYRDVYGWFDRISRGTYGLSPRGEREMLHWSGETKGPGGRSRCSD